jgi:WD40 repeat protein
MYITSLDFSPDGARLAAGYQSASSITTVVFQTGDWQPLYTTPGEAPHFSPDGQTIATTLVIQGASSTALYSSLTGKPLHRWDGRTVSFLPTGELVVEAGSAVRLVDPRSFTARLALNGRAPALAPDGRSLAVYQGEAVHLYSLADGALLSTFDLPPEVAMIEDVESVLISPSGESLAASTVMRLCSTCELSPGPIVLWNSEDGSLVNTLPIPASRAWLSFAPGGKELAVATKDNFKRYSLSTGGLVGGLSTFSDYTGELAFSPDGELLAVGYSELDSFGLRVWELPSLKQPNSFVTFARSTPAMDWWKMAYSPDGRLIALGGLFWQAQTGKNVPVLQQAIDSANPDLAISQAFDPGGQTVALGYPGGQVQVWGLADARLIQTLSSTFSGDVVSLAYSPDGAQLAAAYAYRFADIVQVSPVAQVWQMPSGAPIYRLAANNIFYVAYSPDGQKLATISAADDSYQRNFPFGVVRLWSQAGEPLITYPPADVMRLAFSPDGQLLATGLSNGRVQLWDLAGALIQELDTAQRGVITGLAFSADGNLLAIASAIGVIEIWATLG